MNERWNTAVDNNSPSWSGTIFSQFVFERVCLTILYSDDKLEVQRAYDKLFSSYKAAITAGAPFTQLSCFEEVVYKILNDELHQEEDEYNHGEKYPSFIKLMTIARMQYAGSKETKSFLHWAYEKQYSDNVFPLKRLDKIIMSFIYNQSSKEEKNEALKFFLNKYISIFKVQK
jgi:hypothetical protein